MTVRMIRTEDGKTGDIHPDEVEHMIAHGWQLDADAPGPNADRIATATVEIPGDWQSLHWKQRVALAEKLNGDAALVPAEGQTQADAADVVIAAEVARRAA